MIPITLKFVLVLIATLLTSLVLTPLVRFFAFRVGAVDNPNARRINKVPMPSAGGLAIIISFVIATLALMPMILKTQIGGKSYFEYILPVVLGALVIALTGFIDDVYELSPKIKFLGILLGAVIIWIFTDFRFDSFKIPFGGPMLHFNPFLSFFLTILWVVAITNAVNLIDGLDGLVSGVSMISLTTMGLVSYFFLYDTDIF